MNIDLGHIYQEEGWLHVDANQDLIGRQVTSVMQIHHCGVHIDMARWHNWVLTLGVHLIGQWPATQGGQGQVYDTVTSISIDECLKSNYSKQRQTIRQASIPTIEPINQPSPSRCYQHHTSLLETYKNISGVTTNKDGRVGLQVFRCGGSHWLW